MVKAKIRAKERVLEALNTYFRGKGVPFSLCDLSKEIQGRKVPQQTLSHILRHVPGIVKYGNARATGYRYEELADISSLYPNTFALGNGKYQTIKSFVEALKRDKEILVIKSDKARLKRMLYCKASGLGRDAVSERIYDELLIEAKGWDTIRHNFNSKLIPRVRLYNINSLGRILIMDYSAGISAIPKDCIQSSIRKVESKYGKSPESDADIRNEILKLYKIINGTDFIGDMTFYCGNDLRIHTIPLFFSLVNAISVSPNFSFGSDVDFRNNAKKFWESVGTPNAFLGLKGTIHGIQIALGISI